MFKVFKTFLITLSVFAAGLSANAENSYYILRSFDKCSVQNECSDVIDSVRKINTPNADDNVLQLKNLVDKKSQEEAAPEEHSYNLPKAVYDYPKEQIYKQAFYFADIIDPKVGEPNVNASYPGLRGANQLVIYTPDFGIRTNTNEFGAEATVVGNTVVKLSGADSVIPKNGFVISGHGKAKNWIQQNIILGSKIYFNPSNERITVFVTPETYIFEANEKIKETSQVMQYYRMLDSCYDGRKASNYLYKSNEFLKKAERHPDKTLSYLEESKELVEEALKYALPNDKDEFNGIWIRPSQHTPKEIERAVERLKNSGIKNVFLETYYHGQTIYPSNVLAKYDITSQRGEFNQFDPLKVWIDECHKNKIKVHIWFECFYVGNKPPRSSRKHILAVHPEWANTTKALADSEEIAFSAAEHNGYFLDPANPEVQTFIKEVLTEIVEKYHPDGINLDYIRYPQCAQIKSNNSVGTEWGYTKSAREEFKELYEVDPVELTYSDPLRQNWFEYRQNKITDLVSFARELTCKHNMMLTAVVFPDRQRTLETKLQDWKSWSRQNLIDGVTPLMLTTDKKTAGSIIRTMKGELTPSTKIFPGIFVMFMNASPYELLMQIHETRKMHADGIMLFDYAHLSQEYEEALSARVFNSKK